MHSPKFKQFFLNKNKKCVYGSIKYTTYNLAEWGGWTV